MDNDGAEGGKVGCVGWVGDVRRAFAEVWLCRGHGR